MNRRNFIRAASGIFVPAIVGLRSKAQVLTLADPALNGSIVVSGSDVPPGTLVNEDFEGTGQPSGWVGSGPVDWDESTVVLNGTQSLELDAGSGSPVAYRDYTAQDAVGYFCDFQLAATPSDYYGFVYFLNSSFVTLGSMLVGWDRKIRITPAGGTPVTGTAVLSTNTHYRAWINYTKGTGANAVVEAWVSTTDLKADAVEHLTGSDGTATTDSTYFYLAPLIGFGTLYIDRVRVDPLP